MGTNGPLNAYCGGVERTGVLEEACNGQIRPRPVEARAMETDMATMYWQEQEWM